MSLFEFEDINMKYKLFPSFALRESLRMSREEGTSTVPHAYKIETNGYVYLIQGTIIPLVKIGFCREWPEQRLKDLQLGSPDFLRIVGTMRGSRHLEKYLHDYFSIYRHHGEWFESTVLSTLQTYFDDWAPGDKAEST